MNEWEFIKIVVLPGLGASFGLTLLVWREARKGRKDIWAFITNHMSGMSKRIAALERKDDGA